MRMFFLRALLYVFDDYRLFWSNFWVLIGYELLEVYSKFWSLTSWLGFSKPRPRRGFDTQEAVSEEIELVRFLPKQRLRKQCNCDIWEFHHELRVDLQKLNNLIRT